MQTPRAENLGISSSLAGRRIFALQIRRWKEAILDAYFPQAQFTYLPLYISDAAFFRDWASRVKAEDNATLLVWGSNASPAIMAFAQENGIPVCFLEDGFIRSLVANASKSQPFSLTVDRRAPYFDSRHPSDLETMLSTYDFQADARLMSRARDGISTLLTSGLSKYNSTGDQTAAANASPSSRRKVLVIGQVEDDASIRVGCDREVTNNDVVRLAAAENPDCEILYKPHPDVLNGVRRRISNPAEVAHLCEILTGNASLPQLLSTVDHIYTITSLGGFEALLRGIRVTVLGCPFYAGWGLTDDRQSNSRRVRRLSIEEVFAGAYLLYPRYFNPVTGEEISFEECLNLAALWRLEGMPESLISPVPAPEKPGLEMTGPYGLFGWRHLMTAPLASIIKCVGDPADAEQYRRNPILFFRELSDPRFRKLGRALYPFD